MLSVWDCYVAGCTAEVIRCDFYSEGWAGSCFVHIKYLLTGLLDLQICSCCTLQRLLRYSAMEYPSCVLMGKFRKASVVCPEIQTFPVETTLFGIARVERFQSSCNLQTFCPILGCL